MTLQQLGITGVGLFLLATNHCLTIAPWDDSRTEALKRLNVGTSDGYGSFQNLEPADVC